MSTKFKFQLALLFGVLAVAVYFFPGNKISLPKMPAQKTVYYKWQDAQGNWHIADKAPKGVAAQRLKTNPNANIIQSIATPAQKTKEDKQPQPDSQIPLDYLSRAKQTMQDAERARDLLNQRQQQLDDFVSGTKH
ncbi:MAG: DUF4124 domain-containing protein [Thiopseudomonas sp.]|nr:DUF4124 domain-containing protein [Thiopseudomonas sp.]MCK9466380.1 DUF4124 domain-containing protein [Thiopseudomonas sp.]